MIFFENFESDTAESILYRYPDCIRNTKGEDIQTAFPLFGGNKFGTFTKNLPERMEIFLRFTDNNYVGEIDSEIILFDIVKLKSINQEVNIVHDESVIRVPRPAKVIDAMYIDLNIQNSIINVLINGVEVVLIEDFPITDYFGLSDSAINVTEGDDTGFRNFVSEIILIEDTPNDQMIDLTSLRIVEDIPTIELLPDEEAFTQTISPIEEVLLKSDPLDTDELLFSSLRDSLLVDAGIDITYANQDNKLQSKIYAATFNTNKNINVSIWDEFGYSDEPVVVAEAYIDESNNTHQIRFTGVDYGAGSVVEFKSFEGTEYGFILGAHGPITVKWGLEHGEVVYAEYPASLVAKEYISPLSIVGDEEVSVTIYGEYETLITSHVNTNRVIEWRSDLDTVSCSPSTIGFSASSNFAGATNITSVPVSLPPNVTSLDYFFENASSFNSPLPWDTSTISSMVGTFKNASSFNQPLSWNTASVEFMEDMFNGALSFDQDLSGWDVELIPEEPSNFSTNTPSWVKENRMPKWSDDEQVVPFPHMLCNNDNVCYVDWASVGKQLNAGSFISYSDFLTEVGLEGIGQLNPSSDGLDEWIYMVIDGQEVVFPKVPILRDISFTQLYEKGLVYGVDGDGPFVPSTPTNQNVIVTIQGTRYQVRLFSGIDNPGTVWTGASDGLDLEGTKRSEWSRLVYPIISDLEEEVYSGSQLHSIAQIDFDGNTEYSFTQDFTGEDNVLLRGPNSVARIFESATSESSSMVGYRPILIKLDKAVAPTDLFYLTDYVKNPIIIDNYYKD